jgi:lipid-binding SYLF domain-containing protein
MGNWEGGVRQWMRVTSLILSLAVVVSTSVLGAPTRGEAAPPTKEEIAEEKKEIRQKAKEIVAELYRVEPKAKTAVSKATGYATFSNFGMKIFVAGSGMGKGVAVDNKTKKEVFMDMLELQAGVGMGVKKFNLVWIFETPKTLSTFVNSGWELGAQTSAAAKGGGKGGAFQGAVAVAPGVWLYQLTEAGLALELTAKGTKYYKDGDLN